MRRKQKKAVQMRLDDDVIERIDEVAELMGMSRAGYCAYLMELTHRVDFSPMTIAQDLMQRRSESLK